MRVVLRLPNSINARIKSLNTKHRDAIFRMPPYSMPSCKCHRAHASINKITAAYTVLGRRISWKSTCFFFRTAITSNASRIEHIATRIPAFTAGYQGNGSGRKAQQNSWWCLSARISFFQKPDCCWLMMLLQVEIHYFVHMIFFRSIGIR